MFGDGPAGGGDGSGAVAVTGAGRGGHVLVLLLDDERVGREDHRRDRLGVAKRRARHLDRVDDTGGDEVAVLARGRVEALARLHLLDLGDGDVALEPGVLGDPAQRFASGAGDDARTDGLVTLEPELVDGGDGLDEGRATAGDDALLDGRTGRGDGVLDAVLLLLELDLGVRADLDDADTAGELGQPLLELLAVPVRVGPLDLGLDLVDAALDGGGVALPVDDRRRVLGDDDAAGLAEDLETDLVELEADLLGDDLRAREDRHVLEHRLAAVAEAGGLDGARGERAADLVDDERAQRLALDVLGDDQERLAGLDDLLQQRQEVLDRRDLALVDEDVGVLEDGLHPVGVGGEVRRDVALVELHALGEVERRLRRRGLLDGDDAVLADLVEGVADRRADALVLRGQGGDLGDLLLALDLAGGLEETGGDGLDGLVHAALEAGRGGARGDVAQALLDHGLGEDGRGGRAVTGDIVRLGRDLLRQLRAEVLVRVLELDLAGDGHAVVRDRRGAPLLVDDDVAALRAERHLDGVRELVDAALQRIARCVVELEFLGHAWLLASWWSGVSRTTPRGPKGPPGASRGGGGLSR